VTAARVFSMRTGLLASTVTPGRTAPLVSRTTPLNALCALAAAGSKRRKTADLRTVRTLATPGIALSFRNEAAP
jgi:hypothetical protein